VNKNIEDYIFLKENFLGEDFCDHITVELSKATWKKPWLSELIPKTQRNIAEEAGIPLSDIPLESELIDFNNLHNMILQREMKKIEDEVMQNISDVLLEYCSSFNFNWLRGWTGYSQIKWNRYSQDQGMMKHWDNISHSYPETNEGIHHGHDTGVSFLTIVGFLNNDYEGGELILCEDKKIDTKKGNLCIFPSSFIYPHQVYPVTKGFRYSYVSWVY
jgi:hypothetical protein